MMIRSFFAFAFFTLCFQLTLHGQDFTAVEKQQGYASRGDMLWFIFDESAYNVKPTKVVVTGQFREWNQDMNDAKWILKKADKGLWLLSVDNPQYAVIPPLTPFKYRINDGDWLSPPPGAPNEKGGNLEYLKGFILPGLQAEIRRTHTIWAKITGFERPLDPSAYLLTNAHGDVIPIAAVLPNTDNETLIIPAQDLDIKRVYFLEIPSRKLRAFCSFDGWFRETYSPKPLGANISDDKSHTAFRVFSPRSTAMNLYLYPADTSTAPLVTVDMKQDADGVWEAIVEGNLNGMYYDFTVHGPSDPGNHFYEQEAIHISDPYARVNQGSWGRSRVWEATIPAKPLAKGIPKMEDVVAYELHIQDFTDQLPVAADLKGTIPAMTIKGLRNSKGEKIGFDYLTSLGINTVHLLPVQEFVHLPDDDWKASFHNDSFMIAQGIADENYNWGYCTTHCFAVESKYRRRGTEPGDERNQFRDLVQAFHDAGIAVIIDIVPNHTGEGMDGLHSDIHYNALDGMYYYRTKNFAPIGAYGNEVKTENRPMVQRWLIDQCQHFIKEFGIDGFRIDLAGQLDQQTLLKLRDAIGKDKIVYGEPWMASSDPDYEANPSWDWYKEDAPITFFQDDTRNAFKGTTGNPANKATDRGWAGGNGNERENTQKGLANTFPDEKEPNSGINYLDIHDNWALADQFATTDFDGRFGVDEANFKIAATLLYTSLGPIVLQGGTEMMRSKGAAPLMETMKQTKAGYKIYMHGKRDTYCQRLANNFIWDNVGKTTTDPNIHCDYKGMYLFWQGLNRFRLSEYGKVFRKGDKQPDNYYQWILPADKHGLGYLVDNKVLVLLNSGTTPIQFSLPALPQGHWQLVANNSAVDIEKGVADEAAFTSLHSGSNSPVVLSGTGLKIWVRKD